MANWAPVRLPLRLEVLDVAALTGSLDGPLVIVLSDVGDGILGCDAVEDRRTGERGAGPAPAAGAGHLDPLLRGPLPCLSDSGLGVVAVVWQPPVGPAHPPRRPAHRRRRLALQV